MLIRVARRDAAVRQGPLEGVGGLSPDVLTDFSTVCVVLPPGLLVVTWDFSLDSSEQPGIPIPKLTNRMPIIVALVSLRMDVASPGERGGQRRHQRPHMRSGG